MCTIPGVGMKGGKKMEKPEPQKPAAACILNISTNHQLCTKLLSIGQLLDLKLDTYDACLARDFAFYIKGSQQQQLNFGKKCMLFKI
jgi:hypothetical protein